MGIATSTAPGKIGQAANFIGNQYVQITPFGTPSSAVAFGTNNFSACLWAKFIAGNAVSAKLIGSHDGGIGGFQTGWDIQYFSASQLAFDVGSSTLYIPMPSPSNQFHNICVVRNGTVLYAYTNGASVATTSDNPITVASAQIVGLSLGGMPIYNLDVFGSLDDIRIYNRALSPQEVNQVYLLGR